MSMNIEPSALTWFQIPSTDFRRAVNFYSALLQTELREENMNGVDEAVLPFDGTQGIGGSVTGDARLKPSMDGAVVYLKISGDLDAALDIVNTAGGQVLMPKTILGPEMGHIALIRDTEGNRIGLHSMA